MTNKSRTEAAKIVRRLWNIRNGWQKLCSSAFRSQVKKKRFLKPWWEDSSKNSSKWCSMIGGKAVNPSWKFGNWFDMWKNGFVLSIICHWQRFQKNFHPCSYSERFGQGSSGRPALRSYWTTWPLEDPFNLHGALILWCLKIHRIEMIKITIKFVFRILQESVRAFHNPERLILSLYGIWTISLITLQA